MMDFHGARPKPNLRPPGHSEEHLIDIGRKYYAKNPTYRFIMNLNRIAELEDRKKRGKGPPKKGAGKRKK